MALRAKNRKLFTFFVVHQDAMPTENMTAESHLRDNEFLVETNAASEELFSPENYVFDFFPLGSLVKFHVPYLIVSSMGRIDYATEFRSEVKLTFLFLISSD